MIPDKTQPSNIDEKKYKIVFWIFKYFKYDVLVTLLISCVVFPLKTNLIFIQIFCGMSLQV